MKSSSLSTTPLAKPNQRISPAGLTASLTAGFLSLLVLSATHTALAQQAAPAPKPPAVPVTAAPASEEESARPSGPGHEGVKIHGHWVLEVHNPDGKLADRREFDNSLVTNPGSDLQSTGDQLIAGLLSGAITTGDPAVAFISTPTGAMATGVDLSSLCIAAIANVTCDLFYTGSTALLNPANKEYTGTAPLLKNTTTTQAGLTSTVNFGEYSAANWVLQGNYTVPAARDIAAVETRVGVCSPPAVNGKAVVYNSGNNELVLSQSTIGQIADLSPTKCNATSIASDSAVSTALTYTVITSGTTPTPLKVVAGQIVTVIVTLSFS